MTANLCNHGPRFLILDEFSAKDIVQDLNRLLKLDTGMSSSALRKNDLITQLKLKVADVTFLPLLLSSRGGSEALHGGSSCSHQVPGGEPGYPACCSYIEHFKV